MDEALRAAIESHDAFEYDPATGVAAGTATAFEATVTATPAENGQAHAFTVTVETPTLPAAVEESVGDAVADGWYDTLALRLEDAYDVTRVADGDVNVTREGRTVRVDFAFEAPARQAVDDAAALVDFVEGTYVQGTIPGYTYLPPVDGLLSAAQQRGRGERVDSPD